MNAENDEKKETEKPISINPLLDEVKAERVALDKAREEARLQADRLQQLKSDQLLGSTAGQHINSIITEEDKKAQAAQKLADEMVGAFRKK